MVEFFNAYELFVQTFRSSKEYEELNPEAKKSLDAWLNSDPVKNYFSRRFVVELSLYDSIVLAFLNSKELGEKTQSENESVMKYLNSKVFKGAVDGIEQKLYQAISG